MRTKVYVEREGQAVMWEGDLPVVPIGMQIRTDSFGRSVIRAQWVDLSDELPEQVVIAS